MELKYRITCFKTNICKKLIFRFCRNKRKIRLYSSIKVRLNLNNLSLFNLMEFNFNLI